MLFLNPHLLLLFFLLLLLFFIIFFFLWFFWDCSPGHSGPSWPPTQRSTVASASRVLGLNKGVHHHCLAHICIFKHLRKLHQHTYTISYAYIHINTVKQDKYFTIIIRGFRRKEQVPTFYP